MDVDVVSAKHGLQGAMEAMRAKFDIRIGRV
jgi:hypothetical protein